MMGSEGIMEIKGIKGSGLIKYWGICRWRGAGGLGGLKGNERIEKEKGTPPYPAGILLPWAGPGGGGMPARP